MKYFLYCFYLFSFLFLFDSCKRNVSTQESDTNEYALGFEIKDSLGFKYLNVKNPFDGIQKNYGFFVVPKIAQIPSELISKPIIKTPVRKIVISGASYIPMIEAINEEKSLVGFPSTQFISSSKTRKLITEGKVADLGNEQLINQELLLQLEPEAIVSYGINSANNQLDLISKSGVPVVYFGDWLETHPLGRVEWIKVFGLLFDKEVEANVYFNRIKKNYLALKTNKKKIKKPRVISGNFYNDYWYAPKGDSFMATFFKDAGLDYLWSNTTGAGSLQLHIEQIILESAQADLWIGSGSQTSLADLKKTNKSYAFLKPFKDGNVYGFKNAKAPAKSVLFYELGPLRPDLILEDLIDIKNGTSKHMHFFEKLK